MSEYAARLVAYGVLSWASGLLSALVLKFIRP